MLGIFGNNKPKKEDIDTLVNLGFTPDDAKKALKENQNNV